MILPDALFAESRLAEIYDWLDADRSDLDVYAAMVAEFGARSVLDVGRGTGTFACLSLRTRLGASSRTWVAHADAHTGNAPDRPGREYVFVARPVG